ncbi:hypothetical protein EHI8A_025040 [Entamoeba histolytica HM-1:IMSS-B]|uniref:Uncharacterized protein n=6 Tax=Entamoeba histolytica TaxID=5759 RepID=C4LUS8_ENTH1|nr:hypothetical protein EHI_178630 [Entamoeba histolytica HM-1:IMSS]EMD49071.1 Hypothetical protein EHI5A_008480 [Entamoeba histolytica KU27]EMH72173.1 hypothetical protein EHI8A_025040 [Entamoeba histolytica HM-1:IMSS-B]EMS15061.1 hypothetical protein KM1_061790 [Entamoeba histolytica HM-3:IMSS]ENY63268.1 hypothetical protein EHI7A_027900 [Entamoeba histolytica HM-1:IMSS-A]BBA13871.1 mitosomal beta-barrel outer membrane protein of 30 kDa [synthetic construct]GAT92385.1 hypothetical protein C|eukprot:XP_656262.2 hypothetical protein EHI_178630 [Entamoeba histolytica HM-1:IMSS]
MLGKTAPFDTFNFTKQIFDTRNPSPLTLSVNAFGSKTTFGFRESDDTETTPKFTYNSCPQIISKFGYKQIETSLNVSTNSQQIKVSSSLPFYSFTFDAILKDKTIQKVNVNGVAQIYKNIFIGINYLLPSNKLSPVFIKQNEETPIDDNNETKTSVKELIHGIEQIQQNSSGFICYQESPYKKYSLFFDYSACIIGARLLRKWNNIIIASEAYFKNKRFEAQTAISSNIQNVGNCKLIITSKKQAIAQITHPITNLLKLKIQYFHSYEDQKNQLSFGIDLSL